MKRILILSSHSRKPIDRKIFLLAKERKSKTISFDIASYLEVHIRVDVKNNEIGIVVGEKKIETYDAVYFRTWDRYKLMAIPIAVFLKSKGIPFIDTEVAHASFGPKPFEYMRLGLEGLPIPYSMIAFPPRFMIMEKELKKTFGYPFIVKAADGKRGKDNYLIKNARELKARLSEYPISTLFVAQEFIPNSYDFRIVVTGYEATCVYKRIRNPNSTTHMNNISQGAIRQKVPVHSHRKICEIAEKASKFLGREVCGVDIVVDSRNDKAYILEANSAPNLPYKPIRTAVRNYLESIVS